MSRMTLEERIEVLDRDIELSSNPESHLRNSKAMGLLMAAKCLWQKAGRQATALKLEAEADELLRNTPTGVKLTLKEINVLNRT